MKVWNRVLTHLVWSGLVLSGFQGTVLPLWSQQSANPPQQAAVSAQSQPAQSQEESGVAELPDSPGAIVAKSQTPEQNRSQTSSAGQPAAPSQEPPTQSTDSSSSSSSSQQTQGSQPVQRPVGTAAAKSPNTSGIAASEPAGIAIAPAKQRRVRTMVLRMGAIIGAGVAVGTVVALTAATPSKPPGAH